jgi:hypothetical protein
MIQATIVLFVSESRLAAKSIEEYRGGVGRAGGRSEKIGRI